MLRTGDLFEDLASGLCPDEGFWAGVMVVEIVHDGGFEIGDALEDAAPNTLPGDLGEEPLDHVEPRRRGRNEVQVEAWMALEPALHGRRLVCGVVVQDNVDVQIWDFAFDLAQKVQELFGAVLGFGGANDFARGYIQSSE